MAVQFPHSDYQSKVIACQVFNATPVLKNSVEADSDSVAVGAFSTARVIISASGADVQVTLQTSFDGGTTWSQLDTPYTRGTTGAQNPVSLTDVLVRLKAVNTSASTDEAVTAAIVVKL